MSREVQEYWDPTSSSEDKQEIFKNQRDWANHEDDDDDCEFDYEDAAKECDEEGHVPEDEWGIFTKCGFCKIKLVRMNIKGKKVFVDPDELVKLKEWNEMTSGGEG